MDQLKKANDTIKCDEDGDEIVCGSKDYSCTELNDTLPKFEITTDGKMYSLPPSAYTKRGFSGLTSGCAMMFNRIKIDPDSNDSGKPPYSVVLGLSFMSQYASTFNTHDRSLSFTPSLYSDDGVDLGKDPDIHDKPGISTKTLMIILACVGIIIILALICVVVEQY